TCSSRSQIPLALTPREQRDIRPIEGTKQERRMKVRHDPKTRISPPQASFPRVTTPQPEDQLLDVRPSQQAPTPQVGLEWNP
ncbi:unnamed protein product, partial [Ilex paraguariensis]